MTDTKSAPTTPEGSVARLLRSALELGVTEASRKLNEQAPVAVKALRDAAGTSMVWSAALTREVGKALRDDPDALAHIVREVWSRGGPAEKKAAADALGRTLGATLPYKAVAAARELARMARSPKDADFVGRSILAPILERNPALVDRVKSFMEEAEPYVRRAGMVALVTLAVRRKKYVGVATQALLMMAESKEEEIRRSVRSAVRELAQVDAIASAKAVAAWAVSDPNKQRVQFAKETLRAAPAAAKNRVEKILFTGLGKIAGNGDGKSTATQQRKSRGPA